jgi:hypothetical protein
LDGISSLAARPQYGQVIIEIKVINADHDTKAAGSGRAGIGSLNKEASTVAPRGFRAGPTTLDHALVVTEEDGSTPQAYSDRDRSQASFCLGQSKAAGNGGAKPSGKITNEAKTIRRFYGTRQREVRCDVRFTPKSGHYAARLSCGRCLIEAQKIGCQAAHPRRGARDRGENRQAARSFWAGRYYG